MYENNCTDEITSADSEEIGAPVHNHIQSTALAIGVPGEQNNESSVGNTVAGIIVGHNTNIIPVPVDVVDVPSLTASEGENVLAHYIMCCIDEDGIEDATPPLNTNVLLPGDRIKTEKTGQNSARKRELMKR